MGLFFESTENTVIVLGGAHVAGTGKLSQTRRMPACLRKRKEKEERHPSARPAVSLLTQNAHSPCAQSAKHSSNSRARMHAHPQRSEVDTLLGLLLLVRAHLRSSFVLLYHRTSVRSKSP